MKKILLLIIAGLFLINLVASAEAICDEGKDVAYIVTSHIQAKKAFTDALDEEGLTYELVRNNELKNCNFDSFKLILLNDEYFSNWNEIPINDIPALIVNGRHLGNWGWTRMITTASSNEPIHVNLTMSSELSEGLEENIQIYNSAGPDIYFLDYRDAYEGIEAVAFNEYNSFENKDIIVGVARKGTNLTKTGYPPTEINANSVFFGITKTNYWTNDTITLFKNALSWLAGGETFDMDLKEGQNLVSFPLVLDSNEVSEILANPHIDSVKKYDSDSGQIIDTNKVYNNQGYFIEANADTTLTITGTEASETQNVQLSEGMNLVGITSLNNIALSSLPSEVIEVSKRNEDGTYSISTKYGGVWFNPFDFEPGAGYWLKASGDVIWSYEP